MKLRLFSFPTLAVTSALRMKNLPFLQPMAYVAADTPPDETKNSSLTSFIASAKCSWHQLREPRRRLVNAAINYTPIFQFVEVIQHILQKLPTTDT
jgi:hypothetical protein